MIVTDHFTKMPNRFFELMPGMKGSVTKILLAYFRESSGHHKGYAFISNRDFERLTGLKLNTVNNAIREAITSRFLAIDPQRKGSNGKTCYVIGELFMPPADQATVHKSVTPADEPMSQSITDTQIAPIVHEIETTPDNRSQNMNTSDDIAEIPIVHKIDTLAEDIVHKIDTVVDEIVHKNATHIKEIEIKEKEPKEKTTICDERDDFFADAFDEFFTQSDNLAVNDDQLEQVPDTPQTYTQAEYEYYKDIVSPDTLAHDVYNPCHNTSQSRGDFRQPKNPPSAWQQLVVVVEEYFGVKSTGYAAKVAQQFAGTAKSGQRKDFAIEPPMDATETCAFAYWLREGQEQDYLPQRAERIQERVMEFRALTNHFEHVNFARYVLAELLASKEPDDTPEIDPELLKPAPKEVLDKAYAEAEALLGFSLSGDM